MDLDELQSVQSRERQTDSLQQLRATFYQDTAEYIGRLEEERDRAAERADDPWNSPEVGRLNDDIDTATQTVEAIYERRVGKIVKMASLAAADMPTDDDGLTEEEQALFETLVGAIEDNREAVFAVLDGESPAETPATASDPADLSGDDPEIPSEDDAGVDAADVMGGGRDPDPTDVGDDPGDAAPGNGRSTPDGGARADTGDPGASDVSTPEGDGHSSPPPRDEQVDAPTDDNQTGATTDDRRTGPPGKSEEPVDRATVKITAEVGEIFGVDERSYDLTADDVVVLPEANAGPLVDRGAAERLD